MWYHVNFWARARCRKSKKIKRFFAEVHYKPPTSNIVPVPDGRRLQGIWNWPLGAAVTNQV
jgi:hypothetical protein